MLVVAHGNSLRALVKHLDDISDDDIAELEPAHRRADALRAGRRLPAVEEKPIDQRYLGDVEAAKAAAEAVARQAG